MPMVKFITLEGIGGEFHDNTTTFLRGSIIAVSANAIGTTG